MSAAERMTRLKNDFQQMKNLRGSTISWKALQGQEPYVEKYELTVRVRSIVSSAPDYRDVHVVTVELPPSYPDTHPHIVMVTRPLPFHPNWWPQGHWCFGTWSYTEELGHHVIRMIRTLQFDPVISNPKSPANKDANTWYQRHLSSGLFPCDRTQLPDPSRAKFVIDAPTNTKKFQIG
jgi:ubiquitin-protein ligase